LHIRRVLSSSIAALTDIHSMAIQNPDVKPDDPAIFNVTLQRLSKILVVLNEYSEWGCLASLISRY
jgi:hypothetical protein